MVDDVFKEKEVKVNTKAVGRSGTLITADQIEDDYLNELIGVEGQKIYDKMLKSDSTIRKSYHAMSNPIKSANWDIEAASDDSKDIEAASLMKEILFCDIPGGFKAKLDEILNFPWKGHAVFEVVHKNRMSKKFGSYTGLENLAFRDQRTLEKWRFTEAGLLEKIYQQQAGDVKVDAWMEASTLLIFYNEKKGNDNGYPLLRMIYGNYKRKLLEKQLQVIGIEKGAIGVPILKIPPGTDVNSEEYAAAVSQLEAYTQAESAFIILPDGYELELDQNNTFDPSKVQTVIKAENEEIAGAIVAMWLEMGIGGNSAVGSSTSQSLKFFKDGIEYIADNIADKFNLELIPNLMALNYGDTFETLPKLVHNGIADDAGKELMEIVTGYTEKGIITPDEPLEDHVRKAHNLPKKAEGEMLDNKKAQDENSNKENDPPNDPEVINPDDDLELSSKENPKTARSLISQQATKISDDIREALEASSAKYINDVMVRYRQLSKDRKQNATNKTKMGMTAKLRKSLKGTLTETVTLSIDMARKEVPTKKDVELNNYEKDMIRLTEKYGDLSEIKLNEFSKLPTHIQVLIAKQADLISEDSMNDMKKRLDFSYSSIETKTSDENVIRQSMEEDAAAFIDSNQVTIKGTNASALMVNEGRDTFFFEPDVLEEIHSFTFLNAAPKSLICKELAGITFNTNDAESLRYSPPLHHNCKSYLRANLKTSKGVDQLNISTLSPTAEAKKSITL